MYVDGVCWPLPQNELSDGLIYEVILNEIFTKVRSHFLIHAGAIAWENQGTMLVADSQHGKTTLTLECVRRGFRFLSDEIAALSRDSQHLSPFPRSLRIRPGTLDLVGCSPDSRKAHDMWLGKYLLDIDRIAPGSLASAVPLRHVVILQSPDDIRKHQVEAPRREIGVMLAHVNDEFIEAVTQIDTLYDMHISYAYGSPYLTFTSERPTAVLTRLDALCRQHHILILEIIERHAKSPTFDTPAIRQPLSVSQAAVELMRRFQGGHRSSLLYEEHGGSTTSLFLELISLLEGVDCYILRVGPLDQMADLVCSLVDDEGAGPSVAGTEH